MASDHGEFREEFDVTRSHIYDRSEPKYSIIWLILGVTVVAMFMTAIGMTFYWETLWTGLTQERVLSQPNMQLEELRKKERTELDTYGVADAKTGAMRMPLSEAMRVVIQDSAENKMKYPTNPYAVKTAAELAAGAPAVSQPGAAAAVNGQNQGVTSSPNVQQSTVQQQPHK